MTTFTAPVRNAAFCKSLANGEKSLENGAVAAGETITSGEIVGLVTRGAVSTAVAAQAGNTGDGVLTVADPAVAAGADAGAYKIVFVDPAANAGAFVVEGPDGAVIGSGDVGAAFDGAIKFTVADGATDFAPGDVITVTVSYAGGSGEVKAWSPSATDGSEVVAGVAFAPENGLVARVARDAEVYLGRLTYPSGQQAAAVAGLAALGIVAR